MSRAVLRRPVAAEMRLWDALEQRPAEPVPLLRDHRHHRPVGRSSGGGRLRPRRPDRSSPATTPRRLVVAAIRRQGGRSRRMRALGFACRSTTHATWPGSSAARAERRRRCPPTRPGTSAGRAERPASGRLQSSSPSTCSTRASTSRTSTRCCCCGPPSATVFLQQLGRGLRRSEGKAVLTVLDFIGSAPAVPLRPALPRAHRRHPPAVAASGGRRLPVPAGRQLPHARPGRSGGGARERPGARPQHRPGAGRRRPPARGAARAASLPARGVPGRRGGRAGRRVRTLPLVVDPGLPQSRLGDGRVPHR